MTFINDFVEFLGANFGNFVITSLSKSFYLYLFMLLPVMNPVSSHRINNLPLRIASENNSLLLLWSAIKPADFNFFW